LAKVLLVKDIYNLLESAFAYLQKNEEEINELNVFPVPDGDTGTNMVLTMQYIFRELSSLNELNMKNFTNAVIQGSLLGARGNSGVILSQIFSGMFGHIKNKKEVKIEDLVKALDIGKKVAYQGVMKPVEGTMLTVIKDIAKSAKDEFKKCDNMEKFFEKIVDEAKKSVERTPLLLDVLKEADVVDAGGQGLYIIFLGMLSRLKGEELKPTVTTKGVEFMGLGQQKEELTYTYCTEFLLEGKNINVDKLRNYIEKRGDSVLVVGDSENVHIHVHTNEPHLVMKQALKEGEIHSIKIDNMKDQLAAQKIEEEFLDEIGVISVCVGDGNKAIFESLGVNALVDGGQSMNPSTADIAQAVNRLPYKSVIILPNNKNIIASANQVKELTKKDVVVINSKSIPQGFSAMLSFNKDLELDVNAKSMEESLEYVKTGEITFAVRDTKSSIGYIKKGDVIGFYNDELVVIGEDLINTTISLIDKMVDDESEIITIYYGEDVSKKERTNIEKHLNDKFSEKEIEIHDGGQPLYPFLISVE
jgi:hypothetical protein